ncbi:MAG TPA: purine-nucleoside phosphorylase [Candidatus Atribacteria bacterium]|nr:purine-nucleoside phosphorylase [Candidatus Atribacteria bacterium]
MKLYKEAAKYLRQRLSSAPEVGLILGSGLGQFTERIENPVYVDYNSVPGFPYTTVEGHKGRFVAGTCSGKYVIAMEGRFHYYEGFDIKEVVLPVRVLKELGIKNLIVTNAAGGVNMDFKPGDLMLITDHINLSGINPLRGRNEAEFGPRFPDMTYAYDPALIELAEKTAKALDINLRKGIYAMMQGPSYETPAEIRMLRVLGADAVGMSTVPEVITAVHAGIKVMGISCITNMAAGVLDRPLTHDEVIVTANLAKDKFINLIFAIITSL